MNLSYTQNLEDWHLWLAFGGQRTGTYIDIGAGHPIADNVSFFFYERGWQGIVVEPQQKLIDLYARLRPRDTAVCGLIGTQSGMTDFHVFDAFHGLSTTSEKYADAAKSLGAGYQTVQVPTISLAELCKRLEIAARTNPITAEAPSFHEVQTEYERVCGVLQQEAGIAA